MEPCSFPDLRLQIADLSASELSVYLRIINENIMCRVFLASEKDS